jgi:hypothetical protein
VRVRCCIANVQAVLIGQELAKGRAQATVYHWGAPRKDEYDVLSKLRHFSLFSRAKPFAEPNQQQQRPNAPSDTKHTKERAQLVFP